MTGKNGSDIKYRSLRTYVEDDYQVAFSKARKELGYDLIMVERREIKVGGFLGLFTKKKVQVTFGVEAAETAKAKQTQSFSDNREILDLLKKMKDNAPQQPQMQQPMYGGGFNTQTQQPVYGSNLGNTMNNTMSGMNSIHSGPPQGTYNPYKMQQINTGVNEMHEMRTRNEPIEQEDPEKLKEKIKKEVTDEIKKELFKQGLEAPKMSAFGKFEKTFEKLVGNDIDKTLAEEIVNYLKTNNYSEDNALEGIRKYMMLSFEVRRHTENNRYIMLIGPTGVGKTTSCAKIGANKWREEKDVAFITADTYRLQAVEQLKAYANIMKVPVEVVNKPEELSAAIDRLSGKDVVVMDTAGRSQKNKSQMQELKDYIKERGHELEIYLVLSATSKLDVLYNVVDEFKETGFKSIIFTKIDESSTIGAVFSIFWKYKIPVAYITTGQRVPDDIEAAGKERIIDIFVEGIK